MDRVVTLALCALGLLGPAQAQSARLESWVGAAPSWDRAAARAEAEERLVLVWIQHYSGFEVPDLLSGVVLADDDLCALIRERFVLVRVEREQDTPLRRRPTYGLSPTTFGRALLVTDAAGRVLAETERLHPTHLDPFLREVLAAHGQDAAASSEAGLARAEQLARRGELEAALSALEPLEQAEAALLRAQLLRRQRRLEPAVEALAAARAAASPGLGPALDLEEARQALAAADGRRASDLLQRAARAGFAGEVGPAAVYTLASLALGARETATAERLWNMIVAQAPESPWAWRAATRLAAPEETHARLDWPEAEALAACEARRYAPAASDAAEAEALAFLRATQREDGSWPSPWELNLGRQNAFTSAYAAVCTWGLLEVDTPEAREAATRGLGFLQRALRGEDASGGGMDYRVWVHAMAARCLARCLSVGVGDADEVRALLAEQVAALGRLRRPSGGWTYILGSAGSYSLSFVTAAALLALADARDAGVEVPAALSEPALDRLAALRLPDGGFAYLGSEAGAQPGPLPGAAGRAPVCALALWRWGRLDLAGVRAGLETFLEHRGALFAERGKVLMHTGDAGQGSHYLLFDLCHAAEALSVLPAEQAASLRAPVRALLAELRTEDGAYLGTPLLGPCVGSGFALRVVAGLR